MYEYAPETDLQRGSDGMIRAEDGTGDWLPWRVDATGTAWYRRRITAPAGDAGLIRGVSPGSTVEIEGPNEA